MHTLPRTVVLFSALFVVALQLATAPSQPARPSVDTLFLTETDSYSLLAVRRSDLPPSGPFDEAAERYEQLFGTRPPHVFMLIDSNGSLQTARPPEARDTVRITRRAITTPAIAATRQDAASAESVEQLVIVMTKAWLHAAVESAAMTTGGNPRADVPRWLTSGATMLVAFGDVDWPAEMTRAQRLAGVLSLGEVFSLGDVEALSDDQLLAGNVEAAALIEFLAEFYPSAIDGLMERIAHGTSAEIAVLESAGVDTPVLETRWRAWYRNITRVVSDATTPR